MRCAVSSLQCNVCYAQWAEKARSETELQQDIAENEKMEAEKALAHAEKATIEAKKAIDLAKEAKAI